MSKKITITPSILEKFWEGVDKNGPVPKHVPHLGQCWVWTKGTDDGYGYLNINGYLSYRTHRISYTIHNPKEDICNLFICHKCDNPPCCNPDHLFAGTITDNLKDMIKKGRARYLTGPDHHWYGKNKAGPGHNRWGSKLTPDHAAKIAPKKGELNHNSRISDAQRKEISHKYNNLKHKQTDLAEEYGISQGTVWYIVHDDRWKA